MEGRNAGILRRRAGLSSGILPSFQSSIIPAAGLPAVNLAMPVPYG